MKSINNDKQKYLIIEYVVPYDETQFYKIKLCEIDSIKYNEYQLTIRYFDRDDSVQEIELSFECSIIYSITVNTDSNGILIKHNIKLSSVRNHIYRILSQL